MITDPEAPGRGPNPRHMGTLYRWERVNELPIIGTFDGVVLGVRKGADTLIVGLRTGRHISIRYEHLVNAIAAEECEQCGRYTLLRNLDGTWNCDNCDR